jgi:membrane-associated phospholipid phosphatase
MERNRTVVIFLVTTLLLVIPATVLVFSQEKLALHGWLNSRHDPLSDHFFSVLTHTADGIVPAIVALLLLFLRDLRSGLMVGLSAGVSALVVQFMKRMIFGSWDRPFMFKEQLGEMNWVLGIEMNHHFSFPSGHATAAFSMCMALAVVIGRVRWAVPLAILAALMAYSRVYLSQHFMEDILAGALIGTAAATLFHQLLYRSARAQDLRLDNRPRLRRGQNQ